MVASSLATAVAGRSTETMPDSVERIPARVGTARVGASTPASARRQTVSESSPSAGRCSASQARNSR
ncbi:Uncharacterised protein [Mycobacteroides abscessus subsp. abscessus]|nr:Uncharacterised protein [Mycobacteroides abscessus subsp. abscessus]